MSMPAPGYDVYKKVNVETASQGKLIVMLLNGAIQRAEEAKRQIERGRIEGVHNNLIRAQEILTELRSALNMQAGGAVAANLDRIYEYFQHLLVKANIHKTVEPIEECVRMMIPIRDTWRELFEQLAREESPAAPALNTHGAAIFNIQG
jgi:flagellar secretion chaperone FliS